MIRLDSLQGRFLDHLRRRADFPRAWCAQGTVDSDTGLAIYANAYAARLREALEADHPCLSRYLGDDLWSRFCAGYIEEHPSRVRSLRGFGAQVPQWLAHNPPFAEHAEVAALADFERVLMDVFDAADASRIDWSAMQAFAHPDWPYLQLTFPPSVRVFSASCNAVEIWRALKDERDPPAVRKDVGLMHLLWRDAERITRFRPIEDGEWPALQACLLEGADFSALCERIALGHDKQQVPALAVSILRKWFDEGLIVDVGRPVSPTQAG